MRHSWANTAEDNLQRYYDTDEHQANLFTVGAALAVLIGCVGLFGLASFNTRRRFREIGIRKTMGASTAAVLQLLLAQILRPVLIANLIALSPLFFVAAVLLALTVACLTVNAQTVGLARTKPAVALRYE